jgi:hypothetical protein
LEFNRDSTNDGCHTLQYFINACVVSMFLAGVANLFFILWDVLSKYCAKPIARSTTTAGMRLFLTFILLQTAAANYALYKECNYWKDYYLDRFNEAETNAVTSGYSNNLNLSSIDDVQTYGDPLFFFLTCVLALTCSGLLLLDGILRGSTQPSKEDGVDVRSTDSTHLQSNTSFPPVVMPVDSVADSAPEQPTNPKSWTSY